MDAKQALSITKTNAAQRISRMLADCEQTITNAARYGFSYIEFQFDYRITDAPQTLLDYLRARGYDVAVITDGHINISWYEE